MNTSANQSRAFMLRIGKNRPKTDLTMLVLWIGTLALVGFGIIMVLSSSSVTSFLRNQGFLGGALRQGLFALLGLVAMVFAATRKLEFWKRWALPIFFVVLVMQFLVFTPLGHEVWGNRNWLRLGPVTIQPSEPLKLALILVTGAALAKKERLLGEVKHQLVPVAFPWGFLALTSVMVGRDLGTALIMGVLLIGAMYFGELSWKSLGVVIGSAAVGAAVFVVTSPNRMARILSHSASEQDYSGIDWQPLHGLWALAGGGLFGVGPGNSKAKWSWLPAADNDYIFAIVGEELGLVGTVSVILVYVFLAIAMLQVIRTATDRFGRAVVGGVLVWIVGQALVNIGVVVRIFPVLGVPLPLVSAGGTALISCMVAMGVVISVARDSARKREALP
ncbi:MAG: FtsW/RodA/SpoVE family cell cycle protein [Canibacter sp.]